MLKIDGYITVYPLLYCGYMLRGVWQALNCLSIHATYCVIIAGASPGETKMSAAVRENSDFWTYASYNAACPNCFTPELHWLDIPQRVQYKLGVIVHQCLQNKAPRYLVDCCKRTSDVSSRQRHRSANRYQLTTVTS